MKSRLNVLVTGASGMLGRVLCRQLSSVYDVTGISKSGREGTQGCDISDPAGLALFFEKNNPDLVINTAAYSDVDGCERDPKLAFESNAIAVKNLAELCGRRGTALIHISTDYVFDGLKNSPYLETDTPGPVNIYGLSKLLGEYYAGRCLSPCAIVRTSWLFGPGNAANFVNAIAALLKKEKQVSVLDDQTDAPTYTEDLSAALIRIAERLLLPGRRNKNVPAEIYQICNSGSTTRYEMTVKIKEFLGLGGVKVLKTDRACVKGRLAVRPPYAVMSCRLFESSYGVSMRPWQESLREYLCLD
jgi:dTDP-4-dehydrorhamnose reductase